VSVENVSKSFRIATDPVNSLKERLVRLHRGGHVEFQALRDVGFEIATGETVAILGHNGSGKSTLLKCIAGILTPTSGQVRVRGRLASLLELGAGFHPELSGRENVYINAAFYGMPRREIDPSEALLVGDVCAPRLRRRRESRAGRAARRRGARRRR
jgi:ABC-2 type transport system ATP-binding protein